MAKIITEYLAGDKTYWQLQAKYGIDFRTIHDWVQKYKGQYSSSKHLSKSNQIRSNQPNRVASRRSKIITIRIRKL